MGRIDLMGLTKIFDDNVVAVDSLDLTIHDGEFVSLLGPSGCGKTTILRCIAGLERPTAGEIVFDETPIVSPQRGIFVPPEKRQMGMVFQSYALWPHMTAAANIAYPLRRSRDISRSEIASRVTEMLDIVGLGDYGDRLPSKLSGGQQQRVALARALVNLPRVVLFDEPLSNLDSILRAQMRREIRSLHDRFGITSIYVTHDRTEAMALSDRIVVMRGGVIEQVGTPREIYATPANRFVADFIGFDNIVKAEVVESELNESLLRVGPDGPLLRCMTKDAYDSGSVIEVAMRANAFHLVPLPEVDQQFFTAEVEDVTYLGDDVEFRVRAGQTRLVVRIDDAEVKAAAMGVQPARGDQIHLGIASDKVIEITG